MQKQKPLYRNYPVISAPKSVNYLEQTEGVLNLYYPDVLESHFISLIIGPPGSGKTHLITQLLCSPELYNRKFNHILFVSPYAFGKFEMTEYNWNRTVDFKWLFEYLSRITEEAGDSKKRLNVLIIFDDVVIELAKQCQSSYFMSLFLNRRHIIPNGTLSFIITTYKYKLCPLKLRTVVTNLIMFYIPHAEYKAAAQEVLYSTDEYLNSLMSSLKYFEFIYIRLKPYQIHINFKPCRSLKSGPIVIDRSEPVRKDFVTPKPLNDNDVIYNQEKYVQSQVPECSFRYLP